MTLTSNKGFESFLEAMQPIVSNEHKHEPVTVLGRLKQMHFACMWDKTINIKSIILLRNAIQIELVSSRA